MESTPLWSLLAVIIPVVVAFFAKTSTASWVKGLTATVICVAVGVVGVYFNDITALNAIATQILTVIVTSEACYRMIWKPLGVTSWVMENLGVTGGAE